MEKNTELENWLRGPVPGVNRLLQPAAHAFLQSKEEASVYLKDFPIHLLWITPAGRASLGFHLQHIAGVTDRLITYSQGMELTKEQFDQFRREGEPNNKITPEQLLMNLEQSIQNALEHLKNIEEDELLDTVEIGRKKIPSTRIGVLFHAAEHSQRHIGQMLVTISVLKEGLF
ncbi:DinB family protein [Christiangramia sabulilitoris]|uniref:DinB family protein n=1 Tax=Christiangramia sabulilitoris TaxID=2583991 RepID=A0A550HZW0_9FLAO|nr:DinB family protein [Christiangramia sabulilitoris]TRO64108.1 DinB family protein [Christiangramia sabulilitoris]